MAADSSESIIRTAYVFSISYISKLLEGLYGNIADEFKTLTITEPLQAEEILNCESHFIDFCMKANTEYGSVFDKLPEQLKPTEENAEPLFMDICRRIYSSGINWGRIFAMFNFSGRYALYCARQGCCSETIASIPKWVADVFRLHLTTWIISDGGWEKMTETRKSWKGLTPRNSCMLAGIGIGLAAMTTGVFLLN